MKKGTTGILIIASAIIWGLVIVGCSLKLSGTECYNEIQNVLVGGMFTHMILIWGPMGIAAAKAKKSEKID